MEIEKRIIETAIENGATLAGIASMKALKVSPAHRIYTKMGAYAGVGTVKEDDVAKGTRLFNWPDCVNSVLVIGLSHPEKQPALDWWDGKGTPGNRMLIDIIKRTSRQIESKLKIKTIQLHYYVERGGVFLKDAAVLAGLGCIGKNNMLITPAYGPRIRLRALFLDAALHPTGPIAFDPCADCKVYCRSVCPENAMDAKAAVFKPMGSFGHLPGRDGAYNRQRCNVRMEKDVRAASEHGDGEESVIKYCRKCEFVCPAGKK